MTAAIQLDEVVLHHGGHPVLDGFSLSIAPGEVVALLGPSGCGKTTVLRVILGLVAPGRGRVRLGGEVASESGKIIRPPERRGVAVVFQDLALWPHLTLAGNLAFGLDAKGVPRGQQRDRIHALLQRVGLAGKERRYPGELSGGERQRVAIARAMVLEPSAVLLDEPLSGLDAALRRELLAMLREMLGERRAAALYVTHDLREAIALASRMVVMEAGRVVQEGSAGELSERPATSFVTALSGGLGPEGSGPE